VDYFSRSLHHEYAGKGITVTCQSPYFVATKLAKIRAASLFAPSPSTFAKAAVAAIADGDSTVPYWPHALQDTIIRALPAWILSPYLMSMHLGLRKRYLKKLEAEKKQ
jgi:17beta-estradiol 17-dehydrogenase / very-long-chain 3-oxoacyl-CoA reductase